MPDENTKTPSEESRSSGERRRRRRARSQANRSQGRPRGNPPQGNAKRAVKSEDNRPSVRSRNPAQGDTKRAHKQEGVAGRARGNASRVSDNRSVPRTQENRQENRPSARSRNPGQEASKKATQSDDNRSAARTRSNAQQVETRRSSRLHTDRKANREQGRTRAAGPLGEPQRPPAPEPKIEDWREPETLSQSALPHDAQPPTSPDDPLEEAREPAGAIFFRSFEHYDQKQALEGLTDLNRKLIEEAQPVAGEWAYLALGEERCPDEEIEYIKRSFPVPPGVYAVLVDSGLSLRAIMTATPMYERMFEFNFIAEASFDCWIQGEWMREEVFEGKEELLKQAPQLLKEYLEKDIASHQEIAQAPHIAGAVPPARTEW